MVEPASVSVVMPAYNASATIGRALASIAAQTVKPVEVIVVDDGSTDETVTAVRAAAPAMVGIRLRLFRQSNNGAGAARNRAIAEAMGEYLAFLDADDTWLPEKLARSLAVTHGQGLIMSCHNLIAVGKHGEHVIDSRARYLADREQPYRTLFLRGFISSSTVLVRRDAVVAVGGFDSGLRSAQDYELWLTVLAAAGARFETFADPLLRYTLSTDGITSRVDRKVTCSLAILYRHMGVLRRRQGPLVGPILLRLLIIHLEAVRSHLGRGAHLAALRQMALLPVRMAAVLVRLPVADGARPNFLSTLAPAEEIKI